MGMSERIKITNGYPGQVLEDYVTTHIMTSHAPELEIRTMWNQEGYKLDFYMYLEYQQQFYVGTEIIVPSKIVDWYEKAHKLMHDREGRIEINGNAIPKNLLKVLYFTADGKPVYAAEDVNGRRL
jgi:hypothetical protein